MPVSAQRIASLTSSSSFSRTIGRAVALAALSGTLLLVGCESTERDSSAQQFAAAGTQPAPVSTTVTQTESVNQTTSSTQLGPSLASDGAGRIAVAWASRGQDRGTFGVYARLFDASGKALGDEVQLNATSAGAQRDPALSLDAFGNGFAVWTSFGQDGDGAGIVMRRVRVADRPGGPVLEMVGDEVIVNQHTVGTQLRPDLVRASDGTTLIYWASAPHAAARINGRLIDASGAFVTDEFAISAKSDHSISSASATARANEFVLAYGRLVPTADGKVGSAIALRTISTRGAVGKELALRTRVTDDQRPHTDIEPSLATDVDGGVVMTWLRRAGDEANYSVQLQRFDVALRPQGDPTVVAASERWISGAYVVADSAANSYWVAFTEDQPAPAAEELLLARRPQTPATVFAQRVARDGKLVGQRLRLNGFDEGRQALSIAASGPQFALTSARRLACVWIGQTPNDRSGIGLSVLDASSGELASPPTREESFVGPQIRAADVALLEPVVDAPLQVPPPVFDISTAAPQDLIEPLALRGDAPSGFFGIDADGWIPPDPDIAAGPEHLVLVVNNEIAYFQQDGTRDLLQPLENFWQGTGTNGNSFIFDPVALWDPFAERYVIAQTERNNGSSFILFAVSDDDDPNGNWNRYRINLTGFGTDIDYPNLGVGPDAYYLAADFFGSPFRNWTFAIPKDRALNGQSIGPGDLAAFLTRNGFRSTGTVKSYDADQPAQYFMTSFSGSSTAITIDGVVDPFGNPQRFVTDVAVPSFNNNTIDVPQAGTSDRADGLDMRIKNGVYRNGSLWLAHTVNVAGVPKVRWLEIVMNGWPLSGQVPFLRQSGTINPGTFIYTWMSDIHVDNAGNAIIAYNRGSADTLISVDYVLYFAGTPLGTTTEPQTLVTSVGASSQGRWGDYAGIDEDPNEPGVFWTYNEVFGFNFWRTWVGRVPVDFADCNENLVPDAVDIFEGAVTDCDGNGVPDECELAEGIGDCDNNGIFDACEVDQPGLDCNDNGVIDSCEVGTPQAPDCNNNGVIDSCEIASGATVDCNFNGVPDSCDIDADPSLDCDLSGTLDTCDVAENGGDCNQNGVLDLCEIAADASLDCNSNGAIDACELTDVYQVVSNREPRVGFLSPIAGAVTLPLSDDQVFVPIPLQFTNNPLFNGATSFVIANDGAVAFTDSGSLSSLNTTVPSQQAFGGAPALFPAWDDYGALTGAVQFATVGTAPQRTLVLSWQNRSPDPDDGFINGNELSFQVHVFEDFSDGVVAQFLYDDVTTGTVAGQGGSATIGFQQSGTEGTTYSFNQQDRLEDNIVLSIEFDAASATDANEDGIIDVCQSALVGDLNCDGTVNTGDIDAFVTALLAPEDYAINFPDCDRLNGDCTGDGQLNTSDIDCFVQLLLGS